MSVLAERANQDDASTDTNLRWCRACKTLHPPELFKPNNKHKFSCIPHLKAKQQQYSFGTHEKRAFNCLRCRARMDRITFGQQEMTLSHKLVDSIMSKDQMANYSQYSLIPFHPDKPLSADNIVVVTTHQRSYILGKWKATRDVSEYRRALKFITGDQDLVIA